MATESQASRNSVWDWNNKSTRFLTQNKSCRSKCRKTLMFKAWVFQGKYLFQTTIKHLDWEGPMVEENKIWDWHLKKGIFSTNHKMYFSVQLYGSVTVMNRSIHPNEDHPFYNHCHHHLHNISIDSSKANKLNKLPLPASSLSWSSSPPSASTSSPSLPQPSLHPQSKHWKSRPPAVQKYERRAPAMRTTAVRKTA